MKRIVAALVTALFATASLAATLSGESEVGLKKVCIYSDGSTITVSSAGLCPLTKN